MLYLKYENNFDDSSYWNQKIFLHNPNVVPVSTQAIGKPAFDHGMHNNYGVFDQGGKVSAIFGQRLANPYSTIGPDTISGKLIRSSGKDWQGNDASLPQYDPHYDKVILLVKRRNGYASGEDSFIYKNIVNTLQNPKAAMDHPESDHLPSPDAAGKFADNSFEWLEDAQFLDKTCLKYTSRNNPEEFDFDTEDFTIEFWCNPAEVPNITDSEGNARRASSSISEASDVDHVIMASKQFVIGYSYEHGFVASVVNGTAATNSTNPWWRLESSFTAGRNGSYYAGSWHYVSLCKKGANLYLYVDGELVSSLIELLISQGVQNPYASWDGKMKLDSGNGYTDEVSIGRDLFAVTREIYSKGFIGKLDEIRITKGLCRYDTYPRQGLVDSPDEHANKNVLRIVTDGDTTVTNSPTITDTSTRAREITYMPGFLNSTSFSNPDGDKGINSSAHSVVFTTDHAKFGTSCLKFTHSDNYDGTFYPMVGRNIIDSVDDYYSTIRLPLGEGRTSALINANTEQVFSEDWDWNDSEWTIDLWIRPSMPSASALERQHVILSKFMHLVPDANGYKNFGKLGLGGEYGEWMLYHEHNKVCFWYNIGSFDNQHPDSIFSRNPVANGLIVSRDSFSYDQWYHITIQGNNNPDNEYGYRGKPCVEMYINGVLQGAGAAFESEGECGNNVFIGAYGEKGDYWGGHMGGRATATPIKRYPQGMSPYQGYMEDIRITKGVARISASARVPTQSLPERGETTEKVDIYYELKDSSKYTIRKHNADHAERFEKLNSDDTTNECQVSSLAEPFHHTTVSNTRAFSRTNNKWSAKKNYWRVYANNDYIIYGTNSIKRSTHSDYNNEKIGKYDNNRIVIHTLAKGSDSSLPSATCDSSPNNHFIHYNSDSKTVCPNQLAYDGKYYYSFEYDYSKRTTELYVFEVVPSVNSEGERVFVDQPISRQFIDDRSHWHNQLELHDQDHHQTVAIKVSETSTQLYTWCRQRHEPIRGYGFGPYCLQMHSLVDGILERSGGQPSITYATKPEGRDSQGNVIISADDRYQSRHEPIPFLSYAKNAYIFTDEKARYIFILDFVQTDSEFKMVNPDPSRYSPVLTAISIRNHSVRTYRPSTRDKIESTISSLLGLDSSYPATMQYTFCHGDYLYLGGESTKAQTKVFKIGDNGLEEDNTVSNFLFAANYSAHNYVFGAQCDNIIGYDMANCNNVIKDAVGTDNYYSAQSTKQALLVSGSGVFSNGPTVDSASQLNLDGDFTIEGAVQFKDIPKGTDDNPGMTIFDFGNTKLSNTSGFWTMQGPERDNVEQVTDFFNPNHIDPNSNEYLPNRFIHFAVQRRQGELELWLDSIDEEGNESFSLAAEDKSSVGSVTGITSSPYNSARAIGSTVSGTSFFTGWMDNFKVWNEAIYGPEDVELGGPYAAGIFTSRDSTPWTLRYYYYKTLITYRPNYNYWEYYRTNYSTQYIHMYEGQPLQMWCNYQTTYDPRWSVLRPLPVTVHWYRDKTSPYGGIYGGYGGAHNMEYLGSSSMGRSVPSPAGWNIYLNRFGKGELSMWPYQSDTAYYYAVVTIGDPNRPKYTYQFPSLTRVALIVAQWPEPPPPPKAVFTMLCCNAINSNYPNGIPDEELPSCYGSTLIELGDNAELVASFYPKGQPWEKMYSPAEVCTTGPYRFIWKNYGRGTISNRSRRIGTHRLQKWNHVWPSTSLLFKNVRKGIKGPITVEAIDSNGNSFGVLSCPGITVKLPDLMPIECQIPSFPQSSNSSWDVVDYKTTWSYLRGYWQRNVQWYRIYAYELNAKFNQAQANLTVRPLAFDPNVPELQTGGIQYKWKIVGSAEDGTIPINNAMTTYDPNMPEAFYILWDNFKGVITVEMEYVNYPADVWTNDPEGRAQLGRKTTVTWSVNIPECYEPWSQVYTPQNTAHNQWWNRWYYNPNNRFYINEVINQLGGGREDQAGEATLYFRPCDNIVVPLDYLDGTSANNWRQPFASIIASHYKRGLTKNISYDTNFWDKIDKIPSLYSSYPWYHYAATQPDKIFFSKTFYKNDDGKTTTIKLLNECGEKTLKITCRALQVSGPSVQHNYGFHFYTRTIQYYYWRTGATTLYEQKIPTNHYVRGRAYHVMGCRRVRIRLNNDVLHDWFDIGVGSVAKQVKSSTIYFYATYYYGGMIYWQGYLNNADFKDGDHKFYIDVASNPSDSNWTSYDVGTQTISIFKKTLPTITSWGWGWGWWYYGYYYWGWRWGYYSWSRPYWWWYPYYYYYTPRRTYHAGSPWQRVYTYYRAPTVRRGSSSTGYSIRGGTTGGVR